MAVFKIWSWFQDFYSKRALWCLLFISISFSVVLHWSQSAGAAVLSLPCCSRSRRTQAASPYLHLVFQWQPINGELFVLCSEYGLSHRLAIVTMMLLSENSVKCQSEGGPESMNKADVWDPCTWVGWPCPLLSWPSLSGHTASIFVQVISASWILAVKHIYCFCST